MTTTRGHGESARERAARLQVEAAAGERRRRSMIAALAVLVIAAIALGITFAVRANRDDAATPTAQPTFGASGVIPLPAPAGSKPAAAKAVTIRTYFDYLCPFCNRFEKATDAWQEQQAKAGLVKREFVPVAYLDNSSAGSKYPTRASSAAYCVATADRPKLHDFTTALFAKQPEEGTAGLTNDEMLSVAKQFIPNNPTMDSCIKDAANAAYVGQISDEANKGHISETPTVFVNGKKVALSRADQFLPDLQKAVAAAR